MTAQAQSSNGDRMTIHLSPGLLTFVLSLFIVVIGAAIAIERMASSRPTKAEMREALDDRMGPINEKLRDQGEMLKEIDQKIDRIQEGKRNQ